MACTGAYATADDFADFWCLATTLTAEEEAAIDVFLALAAADIHAALAASGACDCTLASWATPFLKKLNVIDAAVIHNCPCGSASNRWSDAVKMGMLTWISTQLDHLRTGALEVCDGETGIDFPYVDTIERNLTPWNEAQIILNRLMREGS